MADVWINGDKDSKLDPRDRAFAYGDGVFATMAIDADGRLRFATSYWQRLHDAAARLGFAWHPSEALLKLIDDIAARHPHHCLKLQISRGVGGRGYAAPAEPQLTEVLSVSPLPSHYQQWQRDGIRLMTSSVKLAQQPLLAGMKHCNRLEQVLIKQHALPADYQDWLVLDCANNVIESSIANLVLLQQHPKHPHQLQAVMPRHSHAGVAGVMRHQLLLQLVALGIDVDMCDVSTNELKRAQHLLMCNSLLGVVDVIGVDDKIYARWQHTAQLQQYLVPH